MIFFVRNQKSWDIIKIRNMFNTVDTETILSTRIPQNSTNDRIAWTHSTNGRYSVKSGYHYWQAANNSVNDVQQLDGWGRIWNLCVHHKIRVFLWRLCRNNVPVRYRLRGKGILVPISCTMCSGDIEHLLHLFFDCPFASSCWQIMGLQYDMRTVESAPEWFLQQLSTETSDNLVIIATVVWGIW